MLSFLSITFRNAISKLFSASERSGSVHVLKMLDSAAVFLKIVPIF